MFTKEKDPTRLDEEINRVQVYLAGQKIDSEEYAAGMRHLMELHKIRENEKPEKVSPNEILRSATNLMGILLIIRYENVNVITSRAMSMIRSR